MGAIIEKTAKLIDVKTIVTFVIVAVYATLAMTGKIEPKGVESITMMVLAFYFGTQHERKVAAKQAEEKKTEVG